MTRKSRGGDAPGPTSALVFRLFVYGTLRPGGANHDRFCSWALSVEPAAIVGRLPMLPADYPIVTVPVETILLRGTPWGLWDAVRAEAVPPERIAAAGRLLPRSGDGQGGDTSPWSLIPGEVLIFDDPEPRLAALDRLEGFRPGRSALYARVFVPLQSHPGRAAWVYVAPEEESR